MKPLLSILIPTVPERFGAAVTLISKLRKQSDGMPVEVLYFGDNRKRTIGEKRQALVDIALGKYIAFCDDDDDVSDDYCASICDIADRHNVSVITFDQQAEWNGAKSKVEFSINHRIDGAWNPDGITQRFPWHSCAWRRDIAQECVFPAMNWGEDLRWAIQAAGLAKNEAHIPRVLHFYRHRDDKSLAA
jgi:glycosyltransferase involved in cell wall biosynthesis